ncbi:MAG: site-specific DNA-methyltransferase [Desulfobacterales bacterium]
MPTLHWTGKEKIINHHQEVPFRVLEHVYAYKNGEKTEKKSTDGNKIIHGDNLVALKALLPEYEGKIRCIYIDPPYNTGNEKWVYNDNVNHPKIKKWLGQVVGKESEDLGRHDKWLCMMYPRLKLLHKLLADDGVIFISIDDNEQANLKLMMDEIFGAGNFITNIHWKRSESQNNNSKYLSIVGEFIVCHSKNKNELIFNKTELQDTALKEYRYEDEKGKFRRGTIIDNTRGKHVFDIISPNGKKKTIRSIRTKEFFDEKIKENLIYWTETGTPYLKLYLDKSEGQIASNWFDKAGVNEDASEILTKLNIRFQFSKPFSLIEKILQISSDKNSVILDSFAGSGTTAHAVLNLNREDGGSRRFILVEMEDYAEEITAERVKRVIKGYGDTQGTGGEFDFYELGRPMFKDDGFLNEEVSLEHIRNYVYYTETKQPLHETRTCKGENIWFLGIHEQTAYYFYYEKDSITALDVHFLKTVKAKTQQYVIYADKCLLDTDHMTKNSIVFKKIPRDIARF